VKLFGWFRRKGSPPGPSPPQAAGCLPPVSTRHLGAGLADLWGALDAIAREDGLAGKSAVEHYNQSAEGKKDVERWLQIYLRRVHPGGAEAYSMPSYCQRHRGFCLVPRLWPDGLRWAAIHEATLFRAPIPEEPDRERLIAALDRHLEA